MDCLKEIFRKKNVWVELETFYTSERMERIGAMLAENDIPYKVRAALLPVPLNAATPLGTAAQSLWYLSVRPEDASRVHQLLRQERRG